MRRKNIELRKSVTIQLLGDLIVTVDGNKRLNLEEVGVRKGARVLLAYLACYPGSHSYKDLYDLARSPTKQIIDAPDVNKIRDTIDILLAAVRRPFKEAPFSLEDGLSEIIQTRDNTLQLHPNVKVDVHSFKRLCAAGSVNNLQRAIQLYQPLLRKYSWPWIVEVRRELEQDYADALVQLALQLESNDAQKSLQHAETAIKIDPDNAEAHTIIIRCRLRLGPEHRAHRYHAMVTDRFGPGVIPPLANLKRAITKEKINSIPNNLPADLTQFLGQENYLISLSEYLNTPGVRLITVTGSGGSGKTRLALQSARESCTHFPQGVFFIDLSALTDPKLVLPTVAHTLGVDITRRDALIGLSEYFKEKRCLLILDNFEQVIGARKSLTNLLRSCGELKIMVTSRKRLELTGEQRVEVVYFDAGHDLFIDRTRRIISGFKIRPEEESTVNEICQELDDLPLAIELAAAQMPRFSSVQGLLEQLIQRRLDLLAKGPVDASRRQRTMRSTIAWSYELLPQEQQKLLRRLAVFAGGFTREAALHVIYIESEDNQLDLDNISQLQAASLLQPAMESVGESRFRMLKTIKEYGLEQLKRKGEADIILQQHLQYYFSLAERANSHLLSREQLPWLRRLQEEHDNLRAALHWSHSAHCSVEVRLGLAGVLWQYWVIAGFFQEGRQWLESACKEINGSSSSQASIAEALPFLSVRVLTGTGAIAFFQNDFNEAWNLLQQALRLSIQLDTTEHQWYQAFLLSLLGLTSAYQTNSNNFEQARELFGRSLQLARQVQDKWLIAMALHCSTLPGFLSQNNDNDIACATESIKLLREVGDRWLLTHPLVGLAQLNMQQGRFETAAPLLTESLEHSRVLHDARGVTWSLFTIMGWCLAQGKFEAAAQLIGASEALSQSLNLPILPAFRPQFDQAILTVKGTLGSKAYQLLHDQGRHMSLKEIIVYALQILG